MALKITLKRSPIGYERSQGATARALGLRKPGVSVVRPDNPSVRGMIFKINHMLEVVEVADQVKDEPVVGHTAGEANENK